MVEITTEEQIVIDIIKKHQGIGVSAIMEKTGFTWKKCYDILLKLSLNEIITFKKDGKCGIVGGINDGNN